MVYVIGTLGGEHITRPAVRETVPEVGD